MPLSLFGVSWRPEHQDSQEAYKAKERIFQALLDKSAKPQKAIDSTENVQKADLAHHSPIKSPQSLSPIPAILISPPPTSSTPPFTPNLDLEASRKNHWTRYKSLKFKHRHLQPLSTAATNIKPRTKAYKKLVREQLQRRYNATQRKR
ncbi:MAG: hypothetical protein Q9221_008369 [Calogaya cf. arnoldii]